jgi:hypothetical protein
MRIGWQQASQLFHQYNTQQLIIPPPPHHYHTHPPQDVKKNGHAESRQHIYMLTAAAGPQVACQWLCCCLMIIHLALRSTNCNCHICSTCLRSICHLDSMLVPSCVGG